MALLLSSSALPFPTSVIGRAFQTDNHQDQAAAVILYAGFAALSAVAWLIIFQYLKTHPALLAEHTPASFFGQERRRAALGIAAYAIAALVSLAEPLPAPAICSALPVFYALTSAGWSLRRATARADRQPHVRAIRERERKDEP